MKFEEHLLMDLKAEIVARNERRRRVARRLYAGGAVAALAAAAAFAVPSLTGTEPPAYAVTKNADGTVRVEINEFEDADQLERDLQEEGVTADITYLAAGTNCKPGRGKTTGQVAMGPGSDAVARMRDGGLDIDPQRIGKDQTLVMAFAGTIEETAETKKQKTLWSLTASLITGRVGPCVAVDDPTWNDVRERAGS
jgi:hypothetical protein